jgi:glycosyltransferase involved in cell wall biosynthesis
LKILWVSNAPWSPSGYGEQTATFVPRFQAAGHEVAILANFGLQAAKFQYGETVVYPSAGDWANGEIETYADHFGADLIIALCDSWVLKPHMWKDKRVAIWTPIDHYPIPPLVIKVLTANNVDPIAMSKYGATWMSNFKMDHGYVPHGIDTKLFRPQPEIKDAVRDELGVPRDAFLIGMVAANKGNPALPRKSFPQAFLAFSDFAKEHDDAYLYVHTDVSGRGIDLDALAIACQIPKDRVLFPPHTVWQIGSPRDLVANLYAGFDVLLNPAMGEGFGVPIVEAQACGIPVIASDHSAMTELTQAGWLVKGDPWWDALQESFLITPSVRHIGEALGAAYEAREDEKLRTRARAFALNYDADVVMEKFWKPTIQWLSKPAEIAPLVPNRAARRAAAKTHRVSSKSR